MSKTLSPAGGKPHLIGPTTTTKMAQRLICTLQQCTACLPPGLESPIVVEILLTLYVEEESARYPHASDLMPPASTSPAITARWLDVLLQQKLVERRDNLLALSTTGYDLVADLIERIYAAQRRLD